MFVVQLMFFLLLFQLTSSGSGGHSVWLMSSYISGKTQFPEFSAIIMLDDIQVGYYDSEIDRVMRVGGNGLKTQELDLGQELVNILTDIFPSMRRRLSLFRNHFNLTSGGVHVQQRLAGCEVLENGEPSLIMFRDSSNGVDTNSLMTNMTHPTYFGIDSLVLQWERLQNFGNQMMYTEIYLPFCLRALKNLLDSEKHLVMRRVRPRVRFLTKQVLGGAQVTCMATDFYPRHIKLTLLRDGRPVDQEELTGGSVLPNGNGLYQVRKTLTVGDEELKNKHSFTCTASHLSLDNRLEVSWTAQFSRSHRNWIIFAPLGLVVASFLLMLLMLLLWYRKRHRERSEGVSMETKGSSQESVAEPMISSVPVNQSMETTGSSKERLTTNEETD